MSISLLTKRIIMKSSYNLRCPFDLKFFRQEESLGVLKKSVEARFRDPKIVDNVAEMLEAHKKKLYELEQISKRINTIQKEIKSQVKSKDQQSISKQEKQKKIQEINQIKVSQKNKENELKEFAKKIQEQIIKIGNIVDECSPISKDQAQNQILKQYKPKQGFNNHSVSYSEICQKFGLTDLKRGQKVGGHRGYFLKGKVVKLALGLANYGLNFLEKKGYQIFYSPAIITEATLRGSCQLQSIEEDVYKLEGLDSYLIATSQQTLAGYYKEEVIQKMKLPIRMAGYSTCFRKQAGAHGKDIHGLFRVHQFEKVEQFTIVKPEDSKQQMKRMMEISEEFYQSLGIPYRVVNIVSGELNDAAACKFDLEAWYPSQQRYRQLVSVSNCTQYQPRLLKTQYLGPNNEMRFPHMLNGTLVAIQRALTCIVQNNYQGNNIRVPQILQPYVGCEKIDLPSSK